MIQHKSSKTTHSSAPRVLFYGLVAILFLLFVVEQSRYGRFMNAYPIQKQVLSGGSTAESGGTFSQSASGLAGVEKKDKKSAPPPPLMKDFVPLVTINVTDPWKRTLFERLDRVRQKCGILCSLDTVEKVKQYSVDVDGAHLPSVRVPVNCQSILDMEEMDAGDLTFPHIPEELAHFYTLGGAYPIRKHTLMKNAYLGGQAFENVWTRQQIDDLIQQAKNNTLDGTYGSQVCKEVRDKLVHLPMQGKSVLVIGSEQPWVEAICLSLGAGKVTTLEYGSIDSQHPLIATETPDTFRSKAKSGELELFDMVVSFSSLEHSGMGRYGDALNPWGDILSVARAWCVTKPDAYMYLGVPTGKDAIAFNLHKIYGRIRWPLLAANWEQIPVPGEDGSVLDTSRPSLAGYGFLFKKVKD